MFRAPANPFGSTQATTPAFGATPAFGTASSSSASPFGVAPAAATSSGFSAFGTAPAATSGGFPAFGTAPAAAAPSSSPFGAFGAAPTTGAATATTAATPSFGFPAAAASSSASPFGVTPAATGATGASSSPFGAFGAFGATPASSAASATSTAAPTTTITTPPPNPQEIADLHGKTVDQIVAGWNIEQAEQLASFQQMARDIADWDQFYLKNDEQIKMLKQQVLAMERSQSATKNAVSKMDVDLDNLIKLLGGLEGRLLGEKSLLLSPQMLELERRDRTYVNVEKIHHDLESAKLQVNDINFELRRARETGSNPSDPMRRIENAMSDHLEVLQQIDHQSEILLRMMGESDKKLRAATERTIAASKMTPNIQ